VPFVLGVVGRSGAGKTTAVEFLHRMGCGQTIYVGSFIHEELARRQLPLTADNEQAIRTELRSDLGHAGLLSRAMPSLDRILAANQNSLVDALFSPEEYALLVERLGRERIKILTIEASFDRRLERLSCRPGRSSSKDGLFRRDEYEEQELRIGVLMQHSNYRINNAGSMESFLEDLEVVRRALSN
jgi:dephospho-CoA kinase